MSLVPSTKIYTSISRHICSANDRPSISLENRKIKTVLVFAELYIRKRSMKSTQILWDNDFNSIEDCFVELLP